MVEPTESRPPSRRTVTRGAAWAVPALVVAVPARAAAASGEPPPPVINFGGACGNTGATQKGCGGSKTLQVPLTLSNPTPSAYVFQITSMYTCNCITTPTGPGSGVYSGVRGIWKTPNHSVPSQNDCSTPTRSTCSGGVPNGSVVIPANTVNQTFWIESVSLGDSSTFSTRINWRLLDATTCEVIYDGSSQTTQAISPQNCDG